MGKTIGNVLIIVLAMGHVTPLLEIAYVMKDMKETIVPVSEHICKQNGMKL